MKGILFTINYLILYCFIVFTLPVQVGDNVSIDPMEELCKSLNTPQKVVTFLSHFEYERDRFVQTGAGRIPLEVKIKPPYMFLQDLKGDCKDFGNFACRVATMNSIPNRYYALYPIPTDIGHAFSVWKYNGYYYPICNYTVSKKNLIKFDTLPKIRTMYKEVFKWDNITEFQSMIPTPFLLVPIPDLEEF